MNATLSLALFVLSRVVPALFRVAVAVVVWLFTFVEAHHAAILACLSWLATQVVDLDSALLPYARAALAYFATSAVTGVVSVARGLEHWDDDAKRYVVEPLVDLEEAVAGEFARLAVAYGTLFPPAPAPPSSPADAPS